MSAGRRRSARGSSSAKHFDSSQTTLDLIAVGYALGLAASVLLGAVGGLSVGMAT